MTVAPHTDIILALGERQITNAGSARSADSDTLIVDASTVAPIQIRDELYRGHLSMTRELGKVGVMVYLGCGLLPGRSCTIYEGKRGCMTTVPSAAS